MHLPVGLAAFMPFPVFGCSELTIVVVWGVWHGVKRRIIHGVRVERQGGGMSKVAMNWSRSTPRRRLSDLWEMALSKSDGVG
jgi:hypothetical protein